MTNATLLSDYVILEISHGYITIIRKMDNLKVHVAIPTIIDQYVKIRKTVELPVINAHHFQKNKWVIGFLSIVQYPNLTFNPNLKFQYVENLI